MGCTAAGRRSSNAQTLQIDRVRADGVVRKGALPQHVKSALGLKAHKPWNIIDILPSRVFRRFSSPLESTLP